MLLNRSISKYTKLNYYTLTRYYCSTKLSNNCNDKINFDKVVFFGRTAEESIEMFNITKIINDNKNNNNYKILDCPGGPSSLTSVLHDKYNINITAVDPIYSNSIDDIKNIGYNDITNAINKIKDAPNFTNLDNSQFKDYDDFLNIRLNAFDTFINDYNNNSNRYIPGSLPSLPFNDNCFDLILVGNFLFAYSSVDVDGVANNDIAFDLEFHYNSIIELLRVAKNEVRIFPAHTMVSSDCMKHSYAVEIAQRLEDNNIAKVSWYETSYRQGQEGEVVGMIINKL